MGGGPSDGNGGVGRLKEELEWTKGSRVVDPTGRGIEDGRVSSDSRCPRPCLDSQSLSCPRPCLDSQYRGPRRAVQGTTGVFWDKGPLEPYPYSRPLYRVGPGGQTQCP